MPVISVGNITAGGTGKTPIVIALAQTLSSRGMKVAVVSRGYGGTSVKPSDELRMIGRAVPGVVCIANSNRIAGVQDAVERHGVDVVLLDDAFQHRRVKRDLDVVLVDATCPFGFEYLLPRGTLREPVRNLNRADLIVVTRANQCEEDALADILHRIGRVAPNVPVAECVHKPTKLWKLNNESSLDPANCTPACLIAGLGNPTAFERTVRELGIEVCGRMFFADHHDYTERDVARICREAGEAACIVTTDKDAVKLGHLATNWPVPVAVLEVRIDFRGDGDKILTEALDELLN